MFEAFLIIVIIIVIVLKLHHHKSYSNYEKFIEENNKFIRKLAVLNAKYKSQLKTKSVEYRLISNVDVYDEIEPIDYLIYLAAYENNEISKYIQKINNNKLNYKNYIDELNSIDKNDLYDVQIPFQDLERLRKEEQKTIDKLILKDPQIDCEIIVLIKKDESLFSYKNEIFDQQEYEQILKVVNRKSGNYYLDQDVWNSLCKVERAKVTNKIKDYIKNRDGRRCKKCGTYYNLEIDHIRPISKGGRTELNNLQTLCHDCNVKKGNKI